MSDVAVPFSGLCSDPLDMEIYSLSSPADQVELACPLMADPLLDDSIDRQDWYEQALQSEAPMTRPRASAWSDDDDEDPLDDADTEEEIETDPFDDFDEEDFDDDFDDDFEEELEDEYQIEPVDDGALGDADIEEINTDEEEPL
jgi:hypothetical protein